MLEIEGVSSIDEAEKLRGLELRIAEEELAALPAGSFYHHQLAGLRVEDEAGRARSGVVDDVLETGGGRAGCSSCAGPGARRSSPSPRAS